MNFKKLYNEALELFPEQIDVSDGKLFEEDGFLSLSFTNAYENADIKAIEKSEWHSLLVRVINQALQNKARESFADNIFLIDKSGIENDVRAFLINNLNQVGYEEMKKEFSDYESKHGI